jgi:FMN phosphatase YigB (HAD superfamily)
MKVILFDLGDTLVRRASPTSPIYEIVPDAPETLQTIFDMKNDNTSLVLSLVSDTHKPSEVPLSDIKKITRKNETIQILESTQIKKYFEPLDLHMTISSDIGFTKFENLKDFIRIALNKINKKISFQDVLFVTELEEHILSAKSLNIKTIHFRNTINHPEEDEINSLLQLIPKVRSFLNH